MPIMNANDDKSLTKPADPASVFMVGTADTSTGSIGFGGLATVGGPMAPEGTTNPDWCNSAHASEATDAPPVAGEERAMELCAWCSFMMHYGRGPVSHGICPSCREIF